MWGKLSNFVATVGTQYERQLLGHRVFSGSTNGKGKEFIITVDVMVLRFYCIQFIHKQQKIYT